MDQKMHDHVSIYFTAWYLIIERTTL